MNRLKIYSQFERNYSMIVHLMYPLLHFSLLTGFATLAIPNVPSSSIVIVLTILSSLGVRTDEVSLLFAVEWLM